MRKESLRKYNIIAGSFLIIQSIIMLIIAKPTSLPVMSDFISGFPVSVEFDTLFTIRIDIMISLFLFLSGAFLLGAATLWKWDYEDQLDKKKSTFRWIEYSITSTIMIIVIAMLSGVYNYGALTGIALLNMMMISTGYTMEAVNVHGSRSDTKWWPYIFGTIAGVGAWVPIFISFIAATNSVAGVPGFVYAIVYIMFVMFMIFGIVIIMQYRARGKWKDYLYGEWVYITMSLSAKTVLAWLVFGGTMR